MQCATPWSVLAVAVLLALAIPSAYTRAESTILEQPEIGAVVTVPDGWKVGGPKEYPQQAVSEDGSLKLVMLYFQQQQLFEVTSPAKLAANFSQAMENAKAAKSEKAAINGMAGERMSGTGTQADKPVVFKCVLVGDADNKGNTLAVIIVGPAASMAKQAKVVAAALDSVKPKQEKKE